MSGTLCFSMSPTQDTSLNRQGKPQRVLACVLCQQRKVKCDRKFPCANCTKAQVRCVPAAQLQRRRRRRFPERALLEQIRKYENLLHENNIEFESLHAIDIETETLRNVEDTSDFEFERGKEAEVPSLSPISKSDEASEIQNFWHAMRRRFREIDGDSDSSYEVIDETVIKMAWDDSHLGDGSLILGTRHMTNLSHPEPVQILKLWQLFLDNVNPLLRVVHATTMQGRIIEAVSDMSLISPIFEALMFSIYSMAILSVEVDACSATFGSSRSELLTRYQFGCQQALLKCEFLRCTDRDCLTALFLYLVSLSSTTDLRALSSILSIAIRIAQRMGIDSESGYASYSPFECEMRRRLWWALALFDARIGQLADYKNQTLTPTWDCRIPLNLNDVDLRPDMKELPQVHEQPTEAIFAVVRSAVGDFIRNTSAHLDFTAPALKPIAAIVREGSSKGVDELDELEKMVEDKYIRYCDPDNPIQFIIIWDTRAFMAKCRLVRTYSSPFISSQTTAEATVSLSHALRMLECDTKIMTFPEVKGYRWMSQYHFPFPAYLHLAKYLEVRPYSAYADQAWQVMSDNCEARLGLSFPEGGPFFRLFTTLILDAWSAQEKEAARLGKEALPPRIVSQLQAASVKRTQDVSVAQHSANMDLDPASFERLMDFDDNKLMGHFNSISGLDSGAQCEMLPYMPSDIGTGQPNWGFMSWGLE